MLLLFLVHTNRYATNLLFLPTGESALHLAIVYGDFEMVKLLVENGTNVNQRATGRFFLPEDQKKGRRRVTTYTGEKNNPNL